MGDGPLKEQMQQQASEHMTFTGFLEGKQLAHIYSSSDLFVFPSETETFGNVVLESLASELPWWQQMQEELNRWFSTGETATFANLTP